MEERFIIKLKELIIPLMDNIYVYFFVSIVLYFLGGLDKSLIILFCLNVVDLILALMNNDRDKKTVFFHKLKIYLVIMLGVLLDKLLGIDNNTITRARTYIILCYSYNEVASIINTLCLDVNFYIPKGLKSYTEKLEKKKEEAEENNFKGDVL